MISTPTAGRYRIDPERSSITVATKHMFGTGAVNATFALTSAELVVGEPATTTTLTAVVDAASFDSQNATRDKKVHGPKFLDVAEHPEIVVAITGLSESAGQWIGTGTVTAHGVPGPVEVMLTDVQETGAQIVFKGTTRIDRYAHGLTAMKGMAGRWLDLTLAATANRT